MEDTVKGTSQVTDPDGHLCAPGSGLTIAPGQCEAAAATQHPERAESVRRAAQDGHVEAGNTRWVGKVASVVEGG